MRTLGDLKQTRDMRASGPPTLPSVNLGRERLGVAHAITKFSSTIDQHVNAIPNSDSERRIGLPC